MQISMSEIHNTLSLRNQIQRLALLQLLNDHVIWLQQLCLHPLDDWQDDNFLCLFDGAFREWVCLDELLGDLHDSSTHL